MDRDPDRRFGILSHNTHEAARLDEARGGGDAACLRAVCFRMMSRRVEDERECLLRLTPVPPGWSRRPLYPLPLLFLYMYLSLDITVNHMLCA